MKSVFVWTYFVSVSSSLWSAHETHLYLSENHWRPWSSRQYHALARVTEYRWNKSRGHGDCRPLDYDCCSWPNTQWKNSIKQDCTGMWATIGVICGQTASMFLTWHLIYSYAVDWQIFMGRTELKPLLRSPVLAASIHIHPGYNNPNGLDFNNDIALIKLQDSITFNSSIMPICLPAEGATYVTDRIG